jgi:RWD domain
MFLHIRYPDDYPDEPPILDIFPAPNASTHPYFDVASDKEQLLSSLKDTVEENMGMAMIYTLVLALKDSAELLIAERQAAAREEHEQRILAAEREENKKFHGTPVTPETFAKWRLEFRREMEEMKDREEEAEEAAEKKKNRGKETVERFTSQQLLERGLAGKVEEEYEEGDDDGLPVGEVEKLKVTA